MLQGSHVQTSLLTQLGDSGPVIMSQGAVGHDGVSHLRVGHQIDLQQLQHLQLNIDFEDAAFMLEGGRLTSMKHSLNAALSQVGIERHSFSLLSSICS